MTLLFDQNISPKIIRLLDAYFLGAKHVRHLGLENAPDLEIFEYAKTHKFAIVTFDSDFVDLNVLKGFPPKIIWIRTGNLTTNSIFKLFLKNRDSIKVFLASNKKDILEIINS